MVGWSGRTLPRRKHLPAIHLILLLEQQPLIFLLLLEQQPLIRMLLLEYRPQLLLLEDRQRVLRRLGIGWLGVGCLGGGRSDLQREQQQ